MSWHLPDDRIIDFMDGLATPREREHAASCAACRARIDEAGQGLDAAGEADIPEPSPLYWDAFRAHVSRRLAAEGRVSWWWRLGPALAAATALVVLVPALRAPGPAAPSVLSPWAALPAAEEDAGLTVLAGVAGSGVDLVAVREGGGLAEELAALSDEDSQALAEALRQRLPEQRL